MARARNLKPGFFKNEDLADLHPLARLLFAGLWTIADREGRLEDRPKRIKAEVLPYDRCDVSDLLQSLHDAGFILRYGDKPNGYIQILSWHKHQKPHFKESPSTYPAPDEHQPRLVPMRDKVGAEHNLGDDEHPPKTPSSLVVGSLNPLVGNDATPTYTPTDAPSDDPSPLNVSDETVNPLEQRLINVAQLLTDFMGKQPDDGILLRVDAGLGNANEFDLREYLLTLKPEKFRGKGWPYLASAIESQFQSIARKYVITDSASSCA